MVAKLNEKIDKNSDPLTAIIKGSDEMWDVALVKFIFEMTQRLVNHNARQMSARGLLTLHGLAKKRKISLIIGTSF